MADSSDELKALGLDDEELLRRAVSNSRPRRQVSAARWIAVMDTFMTGSGSAILLCERFNLNPDEIVTKL